MSTVESEPVAGYEDADNADAQSIGPSAAGFEKNKNKNKKLISGLKRLSLAISANFLRYTRNHLQRLLFGFRKREYFVGSETTDVVVLELPRIVLLPCRFRGFHQVRFEYSRCPLLLVGELVV